MAREDRILSQSEIDSLLKKIAPKSDEPAAKEESAPVEPAELEAKPTEIKGKAIEIEAESEAISSETPENVQTVSFKEIESTRAEEAAPTDLATESVRLSEYKPKTAEPPPSVKPVEPVRQQSAPDEADDVKKKIADLTAEVNRLSAALQTVTQLDEKVRQLEAAIKSGPESTRSLQDRIDKIAAKLAGDVNKPDYGFLEAFRCSHCHSKGNVAIYVKCTSCGKENWMGWWPEK